MKKHYLAVAALAVALGATACSSNQTAETSAAASTETTTAAAETSTTADEALEEDTVYGFITAISENVITVEDEVEGITAVFDVTDAEFEEETELEVGDEVEITFRGELSEETMPATHVNVLTSVTEESEAEVEEEAEVEAAEGDLSEDLSVYGTITSVDGSQMVFAGDDGQTYYFDTTIAQQVTEGGIQAGAEAEIAYYGDADDQDEPAMATRIVTEDAMDSDDADVFTLTGEVIEVREGNIIVVQTADADATMFTFTNGSGAFGGVSVGDTVTVVYEGSLTERAITATGLR